MASQLGKRYKCEVCGLKSCAFKAGAGPVTCCGKEVKSSEANRFLHPTKFYYFPSESTRRTRRGWLHFYGMTLIAEVIMFVPGFLTPRMTIQRCSA